MLYAFRTKEGNIYVHGKDLPEAIKKFSGTYQLEACTGVTAVNSIRQMLETYSPDPEEQLNALILAIRTACANINPDIKNQIIEAYCADNVDGSGFIP
jgi:hypothetical protein